MLAHLKTDSTTNKLTDRPTQQPKRGLPDEGNSPKPQNQITKQPTSWPTIQPNLFPKLLDASCQAVAVHWVEASSTAARNSCRLQRGPVCSGTERPRYLSYQCFFILVWIKHNSQNPSCICQQRHRTFKVSSNLPFNCQPKSRIH